MATKTIVVADDDSDMIRFLQRVFEKKGYLVFSALEGKTAIEVTLLTKPDLVVLDVRMPIVNGYDVCRYIKNQGNLKNTKVLFLSGLGLESDVRWAENVGADDYLMKPFEGDDLLEKTDRLLNLKNA